MNPLALPDDPARAAAELREVLAGPAPRDAALAAFRRHHGRLQADVRDAFEAGRLNGIQAARRLSALTDSMVAALLSYARQMQPGMTEALSVAATGGYGRGVLAPFSDIDLLFLTVKEPARPTLKVVEFTLYFLWDLGLRVGHATRSIDQCLAEAARDVTVRTSLLDARPVTGDEAVYARFADKFRAALDRPGPALFIDAKRAERETRHHRYGDSPYVVEPNVKEGRGGLRDLQTLYWEARALFGIRHVSDLTESQRGGVPMLTRREARRAVRSWNFLWTLRFHLHLVTGRAEDRLTFDLQPVVGARMGYARRGRQEGVERFMRHYFLTAREVIRLTHMLEPVLMRAARGVPALSPGADAALTALGFTLADGMVIARPGRSFETEPILMLRILQAARDRSRALHPLALRAMIRHERQAATLRGNPAAAAAFLDLLCGDSEAPVANGRNGLRTDGATWIALLNETGFLGRFLPDWARIIGQMQFDTYHVFTVDEHTVESVRVLNAIERGELREIAPVASGLVPDLQSRRALYVAMMLHDIAKGRGGDHSTLGAEIALDVGPALGLKAEETETVSWLVLNHLLLSQTAFKRDIDDPKTILDLAETIQSPERLRLLLVLTVADMRAVSAKVWNGWKATLLRELYARVAEVLEGGLATTERDVRVARAKDAVSHLVSAWPQAERDRFLALGYAGYWLSFDPETHARHAAMIRDAAAREAPLTVQTQPLPARAVTEVTVYAADHAGLFSRIAGALALAGASIVDARIHTMTNGMALDTFWIQDAAGGAFDAPHRLARLSVLIEQALSGSIRLAAEIHRAAGALLGRRMRAIHVPPRVVIDNRASNTHTVLEVNGRDRPGLLHDVTAAISDQGLQIASAHVTTYGVRAVDVFYVRDVFGLKLENERKLGQLRDALLSALADPGAEASSRGRPGTVSAVVTPAA